MAQSLLLLEDIQGLGRKGEVVKGAKPGYIRNFLLPQKKALIADAGTLRLQSKLQAEREKQAAVDRKESAAMADKLKGVSLTTEVKVDTTGKMYGSVSSLDIANLLQAEGFDIDRRQVTLGGPVKNLGRHTIPLRLKEGVEAFVTLEITPEGGELALSADAQEVVAPIEEGAEETAEQEAAPEA